ncbi:MAG: hypothetical protein GC145_18175 [Caulobacter sp.]|nr:hypothetical protein [Caulobacter sp.]
MTLGTFFTAGFRRGLDADMLFALSRMTGLELLAVVTTMGGFGLVFLLPAWWLTRMTRRGSRTFLLLSAGIPTLLRAGMTTFYIVSAALETASNITPFPANGVFYLPNWLELAVTFAAMSAGVATYLSVARAAKG